MQHYAANDQKLRRFVPIIQDSLVYPVVLDSQRTVLSLPPIINSAHSAVRLLCFFQSFSLLSPRPCPHLCSIVTDAASFCFHVHITRVGGSSQCGTKQNCCNLQITLQTRDVLIEATATDLTKAKVHLLKQISPGPSP